MSLASRFIALARAQLLGRTPARVVEPPAPQAPRPKPATDPVLAGYYANLELPYGADSAAVRAARRRLAQRYHPDRYAHDPAKRRLADELLKGVNEAHEALLKHLQDRAP